MELPATHFSQKDIFTREILRYFPQSIRQLLQRIPENEWNFLEEIRVRLDKPLMVVSNFGDAYISIEGKLTTEAHKAYYPCDKDMFHILQLISDCSMYAIEEELKQGFITLPGGHRIGLAGRAILEGSVLKSQKDIGGYNFRLSRQVIGAADKLLPYLVKNNEPLHALIISPPKCGKTTLLRDIARQLSDGTVITGKKVGIVDERSEIAASYLGKPQNNVGLRTDVLDRCPKAAGIMMLIRSMSPEVIITDEIGREEDVKAIEEAANAGVKIIASAHGKDFNQISERPIMRGIVANLFERFVILSGSRGVGTIEQILDGKGANLLPAPITTCCRKVDKRC
jgi:stage III sporulation protein AA